MTEAETEIVVGKGEGGPVCGGKIDFGDVSFGGEGDRMAEVNRNGLGSSDAQYFLADHTCPRADLEDPIPGFDIQVRQQAFANYSRPLCLDEIPLMCCMELLRVHC